MLTADVEPPEPLFRLLSIDHALAAAPLAV